MVAPVPHLLPQPMHELFEKLPVAAAALAPDMPQ
jgi:hypothetical protein